MKALFAVLLAVIVISILILAYVPPVSRDALIHHLALPKLYLKHGGIYEIPAAPFSYYPMNLDLLYMIPLYFGNDIIAKYIHFVFALLTAIFIFRYLRRRLDDVYALLGVVLFLSLPIIVKLSITVYVDLGLIFFSTAALFSLFKWMNNNFKLIIIARNGSAFLTFFTIYRHDDGFSISDSSNPFFRIFFISRGAHKTQIIQYRPLGQG